MTTLFSSLMNVNIDVMRTELEKLEMLKHIAELQASLPLPQLMHLPPAISSSIQPVQAAPSCAALPSLSSSAQLSEEPLLTGRHKGLSPEEAYHQLTQATRYTNNLQTIGKGKGGEVYLMKSSNLLTWNT